jgi:hypothetical protein
MAPLRAAIMIGEAKVPMHPIGLANPHQIRFAKKEPVRFWQYWLGCHRVGMW